jgi:hypothetical protein
MSTTLLVEHNAYFILVCRSAYVPKFEVGIFHLLRLLPLPFRLLNAKNIHTPPNHSTDYLSKLTRKRPYIPGTYTQPTRLGFYQVSTIYTKITPCLPKQHTT